MEYQSQSNHFFNLVFKKEKLELEWIDLLSQLEFVGCRKIIKTIPYEKLSVQSLKHLSEEANHAYLLKHAAEQSGLPVRPWSEGLFSKCGWEYFRKLDQEISEEQDDGWGYPAVSWAIETRVLTLYPWYMDQSSFPKVKRVLAKILAEERNHAVFFGNVPFKDLEKGRMLRIEENLWQRFLESASEIIEGL